jgi:hypothetical protein
VIDSLNDNDWESQLNSGELWQTGRTQVVSATHEPAPARLPLNVIDMFGGFGLQLNLSSQCSLPSWLFLRGLPIGALVLSMIPSY